MYLWPRVHKKPMFLSILLLLVNFIFFYKNYILIKNDLKRSWKSKQCIKCPKEFVYFEGNCYYISKYPANFTLANQICKNYYSHLLVIKTKVIIDFLYEFFSKFYLRGKYWVGGLSTNYTSYWLDGCLIEKGPWWNYCNPTYYQTNATLNQTQCIATDGYGLEKLDCSIPYPFICQYGKNLVVKFLIIFC